MIMSGLPYLLLEARGMGLQRGLTEFDLTSIIVGAAVIAAGIPIYLYFSPKTDISRLKEEFLSEEALFLRRVAKKERYLANFIGLLREAWEAARRRG